MINNSRIKKYYSSDSWIIKDKQKASELHIDLVDGLNNSTYLTIDASFIPNNFTLDTFLNYLIEENIISLKTNER